MLRMLGLGGSHQEAEQQEEAQLQEQDAEEDLFRLSMLEPGTFEEALAALDELDDGTATRLLAWACFIGKEPDTINRIGTRCTDLSACALLKTPALQIAADEGHVAVVQQLLSMGADVNRKSADEKLSTALHAAAHQGHLDCVEALLEQPEIEVDSVSPCGYTALYVCVATVLPDDGNTTGPNAPAMAAALIARGADVNKIAEHPLADRFSSPLLIAVDANDVAVVEQMLKLGKKPPATVLAAFIKEYGDESRLASVLKLLSEAGWGPSRVDNPRATAAAGSVDSNEILRAPSQQRSSESSPSFESYPLRNAARSGNARAMKELLSSGVDPNSVDARGSTALHSAAALGHNDVVEVLLGADGIVVDKHDGDKTTALYRAAVADNAGAVKALLRAGASVSEAKIPGRQGQTVLHKVAARPAGAVLEALLKAEALPSFTGQKGYTPLHVACESVVGRGTVEALLSAGALPGHCWNDRLLSPLWVACSKGNLEAVRQLLPRLSRRQINMSCSAAAGAETPLVAAIMCRDHRREIAEIVEALLEAGADPNIRTQPARASALFTALVRQPDTGYVNGGIASNPTIGPRVVRALVAWGANVNELSDTMGVMPLHIACMEGACPEVIEVLLDAGADPCAPAVAEGFLTPPYLAARAGEPRVLRVLVERPGSGGVDAMSPSKDTYLFFAVLHGQTEVARYLLEEGADMDLLPNEDDGRPCQESLIEIAAMLGNVDILNLLIQAKKFKDRAQAEAEKEAKTETEQQAGQQG